jgi:outer membrane protein TolC
VARVEQGLIAAQTNRDIAWAALSTVLGVPLPESVKLTTPRPLTPEQVDLDALRQEARQNRPDLLAAKGQTAAASAQLAIARAARWPMISATASYALREQTMISGDLLGMPGTDIVVSQNSGYIGLVASWSLFNGGQVYGEIQTAQAQMRQAEKNVESLRQQMDLEVKRAYLLLEAAKAQVAAAQKEAAQAREAHRIATLRYQEGVGTSVEILDAEANLEGAKTRLNEAVYGLNLAVAEMELAVGRDWAKSAPEVPGEG